MTARPAAGADALPITRSRWSKLRRWLLPSLALVVFGVLVAHLSTVDWAGAWRALQRYPPLVLAQALALATASHALYACFDLIGRTHTGHALPWWRAWCIGITSYAFTLNVGSAIGTIGTRLRLYARAGLDQVTIAQVVAVSATTNWMGYGLVAGALFAGGAIGPPAQAHLSPVAFRALGVGMLLIAAAYVVSTVVGRGRVWQVRRRRVQLPSPAIAVTQLAVSVANWLLMGATMYVLLGGRVPFGIALGALMTAAIAGVLAPVPGGLGVLEAVVLALLSGRLPPDEVLAAVLAYRAVYYLVPLGGAVLSYLLLERMAERKPTAAPGRPQPASPLR